MNGHLEIIPCILQDNGSLGPLPKKDICGSFSPIWLKRAVGVRKGNKSCEDVLWWFQDANQTNWPTTQTAQPGHQPNSYALMHFIAILRHFSTVLVKKLINFFQSLQSSVLVISNPLCCGPNCCSDFKITNTEAAAIWNIWFYYSYSFAIFLTHLERNDASASVVYDETWCV